VIGSVDAVVVATPHGSHAALARQGSPVERPPTWVYGGSVFDGFAARAAAHSPANDVIRVVVTVGTDQDMGFNLTAMEQELSADGHFLLLIAELDGEPAAWASTPATEPC
jgi:hypothetical protein